MKERARRYRFERLCHSQRCFHDKESAALCTIFPAKTDVVARRNRPLCHNIVTFFFCVVFSDVIQARMTSDVDSRYAAIICFAPRTHLVGSSLQ